MQLDAIVCRWRGLGRCQRLAAAAWGVILLIVCFRAFVSPDRHTVYPIFSNAARNWLGGRDLYWPQPALDDYRYSPLATALMAPLGLLPDRLGGVLWRLLNAGVFLGAFGWWTRDTLPRKLDGRQQAILFLLLIPLSGGNLNNGQSNPLLLGLILAALATAARRWWAVAAGCIVLATALKVYPLALGLLLVLVLPKRFSAALVIAAVAAVGLPFLLREPGYVVRQWIAWVEHLLVENRQVRPLEAWYRDFRLLFAVWLMPLAPRVYLAVQLCVAAAIAAVCCGAAKWRADSNNGHVLTLLFGLGCCWITVFGMATETSTYVLLAPSLAWALLEAWSEGRSWWLRGLLAASYGIFVLGQIIAWFPGGSRWFPTLGAYPLAGLLLLVAVALPELARLFMSLCSGRPETTRSPVVVA